MAILEYPPTIIYVGDGGDYPDWETAFSSISFNGGSFKLIQVSDIYVTGDILALGPFVIPKVWIDPDSGLTYIGTLTITSNKKHNGNFYEGWKTIINRPAVNDNIFQPGGFSCRFRMYDMNFHVVDLSSNSWILNMTPGIPNVSITESSKYVFDNCFNLNNKVPTAIGVGGNLAILNSPKDERFWNNKIVYPKSNTAFGAIHLQSYSGTGRLTAIENNTIYGDAGFANGIKIIDAGGDFTKIIRNNAVFLPDSPPNYKNFVFDSLDQSYSNMSQDDTSDDAATQSGNFINGVAAEQFESLDIDSPGFLRPKRHGLIYTYGTKPYIQTNTQGIEGHPRPHLV